MSAPELIADRQSLAALCARLEDETVLAVDTEFIREKTYYPILCLIQVANTEHAWAIDPLAEGIDLAPFFALMDNPALTAVFHAARQDLEIFYQHAGRLPASLFDTQIAAQFLGFGESVSYGDLVKQLLNVSLDKAMRFTDWQKRPLNPRQLDYALADVVYLRHAYARMTEMLAQTGRMAVIEEEMQALRDIALYAPQPEDAWRRIRSGPLKPVQAATLRALAAWREQEAQARNIPRGHVAKDEALVQIASALPKDEDELSHLRGLQSLSRSTRRAALEAVEQTLASPPGTWPVTERRRPAPPHAADAAQLLSSLLLLICNRERILPRLVATREELEAMASGDFSTRPMQDWRYAMFGRHAEAFLKGTLYLRYDPEASAVEFDYQ